MNSRYILDKEFDTMTDVVTADDEFAALERAITEADDYRREVYAKPEPKPKMQMVAPPSFQSPKTSAAALVQFSDAELESSIERLTRQVEETEQKLETLRLQLAASRLEKAERPPEKRLDLEQAIELMVKRRNGGRK